MLDVSEELGLKPLGDSGTYLQHFPVDVHFISDSSFVEVDGKYFQNNEDFYVLPFGAGSANINARRYLLDTALRTIRIQTIKESMPAEKSLSS